MSTEIRVSKQGAVATLSFTSPDQLHILSRPSLSQLREQLDVLSQDPDVRALVLTGEGSRSFSAGADLRELAELDAEQAREYSEYGQTVAQSIARFPLPTIAALQGPAFGGGIELALAFDFRLATPGTVLHYQASKLGILPGWGGTQRLPQLVGRSRAKAMMIMCRPVRAAEALDWGLVDAVSEGPDLAPLVQEWTTALAQMDRQASIQVKRALDLGALGDFAGEREAFSACFAAGAPQQLIRQWLAKNRPSVP